MDKEERKAELYKAIAATIRDDIETATEHLKTVTYDHSRKVLGITQLETSPENPDD